MAFKVQCEEEEFRIVSSDGQESEFAPYGDVASLKVGADIYYACVDVDKDGELEADTVQVYRVDSVSPVPTESEDVEVEDDEEDEDDGTQDDEEDEEEEVEVTD
jgi:hypothetical protein